MRGWLSLCMLCAVLLGGCVPGDVATDPVSGEGAIKGYAVLEGLTDHRNTNVRIVPQADWAIPVVLQTDQFGFFYSGMSLSPGKHYVFSYRYGFAATHPETVTVEGGAVATVDSMIMLDTIAPQVVTVTDETVISVNDSILLSATFKDTLCGVATVSIGIGPTVGMTSYAADTGIQVMHAWCEAGEYTVLFWAEDINGNISDTSRVKITVTHP